MRGLVLAGIATCALAVTILVMPVAPLSTPAAAAKKVIIVKQSKVLAACNRTAGCWYDTKGGVGCSPNTCFQCSKGKCFAVIKGGKTPSGGDLGKLLVSPREPPKSAQTAKAVPKAGAAPKGKAVQRAGAPKWSLKAGAIATPRGAVLQQPIKGSGSYGRGRPAQNRK
jgi:hypothetical protein